MRRSVYRNFLASASLICWSFSVGGCVLPNVPSRLPGELVFERDQLVVHSDFYIPSKHRLIEELVLKRWDIAEQLDLPFSEEPINCYIFEREEPFRKFLAEEHPEFPNRRAIFLKNDTSMSIFAFWGEEIGEDLRHEVAHGYLHSVVPNLELWLDEGLAEYYEVGRGRHGLNKKHIVLLSESFRRGRWEPDLTALEALRDPVKMTQLNYAEAWLWVHFLLNGELKDAELLQNQLAQLRASAESSPLSVQIDDAIADKEVRLIEHLKALAKQL